MRGSSDLVVPRRIYCIDSSSLIYCQRSFGHRPSQAAFFAAVWDLLDRLADDGRLIAPHLVFIEITKNKDRLGLWAEGRTDVFRPKGEHAALVVEILKEPGQQLVDPTAARGSEEADPWVIALAEAVMAQPPTLFDDPSTIYVVCEETKPGGMPDICKRRRIECIDFIGMLAAEGIAIGPSVPFQD